MKRAPGCHPARAPVTHRQDGLQRERFIPFIDLVKERLDVMELGGDHDYRLDRLRNFDVYLTPLGAWANAKLDEAFRALSGGADGEPRVLRTQGRDVEIGPTRAVEFHRRDRPHRRLLAPDLRTSALASTGSESGREDDGAFR